MLRLSRAEAHPCALPPVPRSSSPVPYLLSLVSCPPSPVPFPPSPFPCSQLIAPLPHYHVQYLCKLTVDLCRTEQKQGRKRVGFSGMKAPAREGTEVFDADGKESIGKVNPPHEAGLAISGS